MRKNFLIILRRALWNESFEGILSPKEFKGVLSLAEGQTVFGLVFDAIENSKVKGSQEVERTDTSKTQLTILGAIGMQQQIRRQNALINKELSDFADKCNRQGIDYLVVKGQTIDCLYPKPGLRQAGDIDFLVHDSSTSQTTGSGVQLMVDEISELLGVKIPKMVEYEVSFNRHGIVYELHKSLRGWAKRRHQTIWDSLIEQEWKENHYVEIDGVKVRTLSPTQNAAYVFIHLFFHFIREGVSLRQLCDWMMVLHHYKDKINKKKLIDILSGLDLIKAYKAFGSILIEDFGLPASEFPFELSDNDRKWHDRILEDIFKGGNFGRLRHQAKSTWNFKMETLCIALRNSLRYYRLCPSEIGGMIPRLVKVNLRIMMSR